MSIRERIMALPSHYVGSDYEALGFMSSAIHHKAFRIGLDKAADLAEARERELLERQAAMIAELRDVRRAIAYAAQSDNVMLAVYNKLDMAINNYGEP
jgi:hypothetical protein